MGRLGRHNNGLLVRNVVFGVEDGLVSTVGLLSGIAAAGVPRQTIFLTGVVLIFVEALSMAIGSLLSEHSTEEYAARHEVPLTRSVLAATVMFFSYLLAGLVPLAPYALVATGSFFWSVGWSVVGMVILGGLSGWMFQVDVVRKTLETVILGGLAIVAGVVVGRLALAL